MAETTREVQIRLTAKDAASGIIAQAAQKIQRDVGGMESQMRSFNKTLTLLRGGGVVAGIAMVAGTISGLAKEMVTLRDANEGAGATAKEALAAYADRLPILGDMINTMTSLVELYTQEEATEKKKLAAAAALNKTLGERYAILQQIDKITAGNAKNSDPYADTQREIDVLRNTNPYEIEKQFYEKQFYAGQISGDGYAKKLDESGYSAAQLEVQRRQRDLDFRRKADADRKAMEAKPSMSLGDIQTQMAKLAIDTRSNAYKEAAPIIKAQTDQAMRIAGELFKGWSPGGDGGKATALAEVDRTLKIAGSLFQRYTGGGSGVTDWQKVMEREEREAKAQPDLARTAQLREARFLTGAGARNPLLEPTKETAKQAKRTADGISLLAQAIREGTAVPFLP